MNSKHKKAVLRLKKAGNRLKNINSTFIDSNFQTIFKYMPFKAALINLDGYIIDVNEAAVKLYGAHSQKDFIGKSMYEFVDTAYHKKVSRAWAKLIRSGKIDDVELVFVNKNGEKRNIIVSAKVLRELNGENMCVIAMAKDITHQKVTEAAFREIAEKYSYLFNNTSDGVCINDLKSHVLEVNDAYCSMSGYARDELIGMHISGVEALEGPKEIKSRIKKLLRNGGHDRFESKHRRKDGTVFDVDITLLYFDKEGGRIASFVRDITNQKHMQNLFKTKSKELQTIIDANPAMIFFKDLNNNLLRVNKAFGQFMGLSREKLEGKSAFDILPKKQAKQFWKDDIEVIKTGKAKIGIIETIERPKGTRIMQLDKVPYIDESGKITGVIAFAIDITERKKTEEALRKSEERYRGMVESQQDLIVRVTPAGVFTFVNEVYCRTFDKSKEDLLGKSFMPLVHPDDLKATLVEMKKLNVPPYRISVDQRAKTAEGWKWLSWEDYAIRDSNGKIIEIQAVGRDITDRKRAEEMLRDSLRHKDEFISIASHELKTPLTSIKAFNQILMREMKDLKNKDAFDVTLRLDDQVNKLSSLISDFLDVTKIESGKLLLLKEHFDLMDMVRETIHDVESISPEITDKIVLKGKVRKKIYGDRFRLSQVLLNFLTNAVKYASESKHYVVSVKTLKNCVRISVKDYGSGISVEDQDHLFERFFQADNSDKSAKTLQSLGLGLYISSEIVSRHKGRIWVKSAPGKGSEFFFTIPNKVN